MAIKMRRGKLKDFDPEKMTPGEIAITNETDVEKQKVFACFAPGAVKQMATYEDMERNVETALSGASQSILEGITKDINSVIDAANTAAENAQDAADNVSQALNNANTATENANKAAELANDAYINYQNNTAATAEKLSGEHRIDGAKFQGDVDVHHYGVCNSAASAQVKQVDIPYINMSYGTRIDVKFTHGNTADSPKLQLNTWPAHPITYKGNPIPANYIMEKSLLTFEYDLGDKWHVVGDLAQAQLDEFTDFFAAFARKDSAMSENGKLYYVSRGVIQGESSTLPYAKQAEIDVSVGEIYKIVTYRTSNSPYFSFAVSDVTSNWLSGSNSDLYKDGKNIFFVSIPNNGAKLYVNSDGTDADIEIYKFG